MLNPDRILVAIALLGFFLQRSPFGPLSGGPDIAEPHPTVDSSAVEVASEISCAEAASEARAARRACESRIGTDRLGFEYLVSLSLILSLPSWSELSCWRGQSTHRGQPGCAAAEPSITAGLPSQQ